MNFGLQITNGLTETKLNARAVYKSKLTDRRTVTMIDIVKLKTGIVSVSFPVEKLRNKIRRQVFETDLEVSQRAYTQVQKKNFVMRNSKSFLKLNNICLKISRSNWKRVAKCMCNVH